MRRLSILLAFLLLLPHALPAVLLTPENNSISGTSVIFSWIPEENAENQRLKVDNDQAFPHPEVDVLLEPWENSYRAILELGVYWWGIWTLSGGQWIRSENIWTFTVEYCWVPLEGISCSTSAPVPAPIPLAPENLSNTNDNTPLLAWENLAPADNFHLQLDKDENFSSPLDLFTPSRTIESPPLEERVYFWRVRASRSGVVSDWSAVFSFRVDITPPSAPAFLWPADGESFTDSVPILSWEAPSENSLPLTFLVQLDNDPDFSAPENIWVSENSWTPAALGQDNYFWRVKAKDNAGNEGEWSPARRFEILDTVPPSPPAPLFPLWGENTNDNTPLFKWGPPPENSLPLVYCVQVSPDRYEIFAATWTGNENWECPSELSDGLWYWRVCARDGAGNTGLFFDWILFTVDTVPPSPPPLLSPQDSADIDGTVVEFKWGEGSDDSTGIKGYLLQLSASPSFLPLEMECFLTGHEFLYSLPVLGEWYWRVGSVDGAGNVGWSEGGTFVCRGWRELERVEAAVSTQGIWGYLEGLEGSSRSSVGEWQEAEIWVSLVEAAPRWRILQALASEVWGFAKWGLVDGAAARILAPVPAPHPLAPENSSHLSRVYLRWENSKAADNFEIQTDMPSKFWRPFRFTHKSWFSTENSFDLPLENLTDGNYLWRVRAWRSGTPSPWSEVYTFVLDRDVPTPAPLLPEDNLNLGRTWVTFNWGEVQDATPPVQYEIQVSTTQDFASYLSSGWLPWRTWDGEFEEGVYFWRVRARDNLGNLSAPSAPRSFRVDLTPPAAPRLLSPPVGAWLTSTSVSLCWERVEDNSLPVIYLVFVDDDADFSSPNLAVQTLTDNLTVTVTDGTWYWRVIAVDNAGNRALPSAGYFRVDSTPPAIPAQVSPPSTLLTSPVVRFEWSSAEDLNGVYYDFKVEGVIERENLRENSLQLSLPPGRYVWRVRSRDGLGNSRGWSGPSSFEIRDVRPPSPLLLEPLSKTVEEDFTLRVKMMDDFGIDENRIGVRMDGQERGFELAGDLLVSEFRNLPAGGHLIEVLIPDVGGNESSLRLEVWVVPRVLTELSVERGKVGETLVLGLRVRNRSENRVSKRYAMVLGGQVKELEISLDPREETSVSVEFETKGLGAECVVELLDLESGARTCVPLHLAGGFPFLTLLPVTIGAAAGFWLWIKRPRAAAPAETREEEEKFPLPLPPPQREPDDYSTLASLFKPELQTPFTKEWSRLTKRYGAQLSPLMEEYAKLLREGPAPRLIERYRGLVRGRRG